MKDECGQGRDHSALELRPGRECCVTFERHPLGLCCGCGSRGQALPRRALVPGKVRGSSSTFPVFLIPPFLAPRFPSVARCCLSLWLEERGFLRWYHCGLCCLLRLLRGHFACNLGRARSGLRYWEDVVMLCCILLGFLLFAFVLVLIVTGWVSSSTSLCRLHHDRCHSWMASKRVARALLRHWRCCSTTVSGRFHRGCNAHCDERVAVRTGGFLARTCSWEMPSPGTVLVQGVACPWNSCTVST